MFLYKLPLLIIREILKIAYYYCVLLITTMIIVYHFSSTEEKGMTEDEMVRCYHRLHAYEFEQAPGVGDEQGSLACCSLWGHRVVHA